MPFDPSKPANGSPLNSAEMRDFRDYTEAFRQAPIQ
jgi:hypothetical protein